MPFCFTANILAGSKTSRLNKRLVYDLQIVQSISARQSSGDFSSSFQIVVTPKPGEDLEKIQAIIDEEIAKLQSEPPSEREVQRAKNGIESSFLFGMERVGGFGGKADRLNSYYRSTGDPDYFAEDLARYMAVTPTDVQQAVVDYLPLGRRVELTVKPGAEK